MQLAVTFATIVLSLALATEASPVHAAINPSRRASDNGYCKQLLNICAASPNALSNPWSVKACLFGAGCFGGQRPVDGFLVAVAAAKHASSAPASHNVPHISQAVFNSISTNGKAITQQNYIDGAFGTLATTNGPFPDATFVIQDFSRLAQWTAFCYGQGIPSKNFADYYQFSATVNSPGCGRPPLSSAMRLTTITLRPITTASAIPSTAATATFVGTATATTFVGTIPTQSSGLEASCQMMFNACAAQSNQAVSDAWSHPTCLFAATCFGGQHPVDSLLLAAFNARNRFGAAPISVKETRLSAATLETISTDGKTITQQNWIDGYYGTLEFFGGPFPTSASVVINDFNRVRAWTGFCKGGIPFKNVADYFQFSSSVSSNTSC
ncbi:hypothetical protein D9619_007995 [Psilocybe cf. subviscida]|uniref:Carboxylic ester hydrolase n=1 Tax=Psilocybe cf. subviscida TaxID=2480587 RepID=A0A8H5ATW2_9AGAR|nr:hypothetical protein D9619_007995 [Psilocybe cf. subviscida]